MLDVKIYGLCLERLRHQIHNAHNRDEERVLLEAYCTADTEEIVDILELYDLDDKTDEGLWEKLGELAYTVSVLLGHTLEFGYGPNGEIGLFVVFNDDTVTIDLDVRRSAPGTEHATYSQNPGGRSLIL